MSKWIYTRDFAEFTLEQINPSVVKVTYRDQTGFRHHHPLGRHASLANGPPSKPPYVKTAWTQWASLGRRNNYA